MSNKGHRRYRNYRRCDWRTEDGQRCKKNAQGQVGMLHLCRTCFNTKMLKRPLPLESLDEPLVIATTSEGRPVDAAPFSAPGRTGMTPWLLSDRADPRACAIADRHYNRQKVGTPQFVPPGRCVVLLTALADSLWVTSWPFAEYVKHAWPGAWVNSCFRRAVTNSLFEQVGQEGTK